MLRFSRLARIILLVLAISGLPPRMFCQTPAEKTATDSMAEAPQILVAPLFIEAAGFTSTISIVGELSFGVTAQVVVFDHKGAQIASETVALPAHSRVAVGIGECVAPGKHGRDNGFSRPQ